MAVAINIGIMLLVIPVVFEVLGKKYEKAKKEI